MKLEKTDSGINLELERLNEFVNLTFRACEIDISKKISIKIYPQIHKNQPRFDVSIDAVEQEALQNENIISIIYHPGIEGDFRKLDTKLDARYKKMIKKLLNYVQTHCDIPPQVYHEAYSLLDEIEA